MSREIEVLGKNLIITGRLVRVARLEHEWHEDIVAPDEFVAACRRAKIPADLFTFWQRLPDVQQRFDFHCEPEGMAVLRVTTYDDWLKKQINNKTRNLVQKAQKKGVVLRFTPFDDEFIHGMARIFNESPVRQGMRFWHYGKDVQTLKREFSRYLFREEIVGAYCGNELIGFIFLSFADRYAMLGQIISMIRHRDKSPNNALIAKAVEICAERNIPYLTYAVWPRPGTLREFKKHNGFECVEAPRYYVPLTTRGSVALGLRLHRSPTDHLPETMVNKLKVVRSHVYAWRFGRTPVV